MSWIMTNDQEELHRKIMSLGIPELSALSRYDDGDEEDYLLTRIERSVIKAKTKEVKIALLLHALAMPQMRFEKDGIVEHGRHEKKSIKIALELLEYDLLELGDYNKEKTVRCMNYIGSQRKNRDPLRKEFLECYDTIYKPPRT